MIRKTSQFFLNTESSSFSRKDSNQQTSSSERFKAVPILNDEPLRHRLHFSSCSNLNQRFKKEGLRKKHSFSMLRSQSLGGDPLIICSLLLKKNSFLGGCFQLVTWILHKEIDPIVAKDLFRCVKLCYRMISAFPDFDGTSAWHVMRAALKKDIFTSKQKSLIEKWYEKLGSLYHCSQNVITRPIEDSNANELSSFFSSYKPKRNLILI